MPDLEGALTDLSDSLGAWTYALVGGARLPRDRRLRRPDRAGRDGGRARRRGRRRGRRRPACSMLLIAWAAAALGDLAELHARPPARPALPGRATARASASRAPRLERVEGFFDRHGGKAILIGRFIGLVRAVAPFLAGASGMRLRAFLPWSLLGHRGVGDDLHARRLRLPRLVRDGREAPSRHGALALGRARGRRPARARPASARGVVGRHAGRPSRLDGVVAEPALEPGERAPRPGRGRSRGEVGGRSRRRARAGVRTRSARGGRRSARWRPRQGSTSSGPAPVSSAISAASESV